MKTLLEIRERLKIFLGKYDRYIYPVLKFVLALVTFLLLNSHVGFMKKLDNPGIAFVLAILCAFLPINVTVVFAAILILLHAYALSLEVFAITLVIFAIMLLLFFSTAPKFGYVLLLTPLAFVLKIPYFVPLAMGLVSAPVAAVPVACGTIVYFILHYLGLNTAMLSSAQSSTVTEKVTYLLDNVLNNKEMILTVVAFALTIVIVYMIRRLPADHSWTIAVVAGAVADAIVLLSGSLVLGISPKFVSVIIGGIVSALLALILQLTVFSLDYSRTEFVQFEDDEYYYYVKAVPKISIAVPEKKVKKINAQKTPQRRSSSGRKKSSSVHR